LEFFKKDMGKMVKAEIVDKLQAELKPESAGSTTLLKQPLLVHILISQFYFSGALYPILQLLARKEIRRRRHIKFC
jgi:hypothetical protein